MIVFAVIMLTVFTGVWIYVWDRLILPMHLTGPWIWAAGLLFASLFLIQVGRMTLFRRAKESPLLLFVAYFSLGLISHLFFATLFKDLVWVWPQYFLPSAAAIFLQENEIWASWVVIGACLLGNAFGTRTALKGPSVRTVDIFLSQWPKSQDGFSVAQISDLHVGPMIKRPYVENVVTLTNALKADLIAVSGDLGDSHVSGLQNDLEPLRSLRATHGVFYVTGNHEYYWNVEEWISKVVDLGFHHLHNEGRRLKLTNKDLWIAGVPDASAGRMKKDHVTDMKRAISSDESNGALKLLLAHQPKSAHEAEKHGFDLMLSGHTHWGQYFPFTLLVGWFNPVHKALNQFGKMQIYVNAGTGYWGPPLRLGVPSEITLIRLRSPK